MAAHLLVRHLEYGTEDTDVGATGKHLRRGHLCDERDYRSRSRQRCAGRATGRKVGSGGPAPTTTRPPTSRATRLFSRRTRPGNGGPTYGPTLPQR